MDEDRVQGGVAAGERHDSGRQFRHDPALVLIQATLQRCAATFGTQRARFLRYLPTGDWQVCAVQQEKLTVYPADYAEKAMAWAVALSRFPLRATRPRITNADGDNVRPIAVTTYFGIPVVCGDQIVGVIELGGRIDGDPATHVETLANELTELGIRLMHDPFLSGAPVQSGLDSECRIDGGCWSTGDAKFSPEEWTLLAALNGPEPLRSIAERASLTEDRVIELAAGLSSRGFVSIIPPANADSGE